MPWGWLESWRPDYREPSRRAKVGRPYKGSRELVKAARKASRRSRR